MKRIIGRGKNLKVITLPRGAGKTTAAIIESAKTGKYILVMNKQQAKSIYDMARKLKIDIHFPITIQELRESNSRFIKEVIVDEAGAVLEELIDKKITMMTVTESNKEAEQ